MNTGPIIPAPRDGHRVERVVPATLGHRGAACLLAEGHKGACIGAPRRVVLVATA